MDNFEYDLLRELIRDLETEMGCLRKLVGGLMIGRQVHVKADYYRPVGAKKYVHLPEEEGIVESAKDGRVTVRTNTGGSRDASFADVEVLPL